MPNITATGTYTKDSDGFGFLASAGGRNRTLLFAGSALPSTLEIRYTDDRGTDRTLQYGVIESLPASVEIGLLALDLKIVVTGGSPNFNVTSGGVEDVRS